MAVLYSERVHVLTLLDRGLLDSYIAHPRPEVQDARQAARLYHPSSPSERAACASFGVPQPLTDASLEYLKFVSDNYDDLSLLAREGVLVSHFPKVYSHGGTFRADRNILRTFARWPPSYWHFTYSPGPLPPEPLIAAFQGHLCTIGIIAQQEGLGLSTWSWDFQQAMWDSVAQLREGGPITMVAPEFPPRNISERGLTETHLAQTVLERYLPRSDDLPFPEILELRHRYASELKAFQVGVRRLATEIELDQVPANLNLQIEDILFQHVDPAVHELDAALTGARWNILKNLTGGASVTRAAIGVGIALFSGAPFDISAALGAGSAVVGAVVESEVEKANRLRSSQWALLFHLTKYQKRKVEEAKRRHDPFSAGP